jgi:hypothetical protein
MLGALLEHFTGGREMKGNDIYCRDLLSIRDTYIRLLNVEFRTIKHACS